MGFWVLLTFQLSFGGRSLRMRLTSSSKHAWNPEHYGCSPCFTAPTHVFVVWPVPCLLMGKDTGIKPVAGLCRVWDCQNTRNSAGVQPLALCSGSREMQGRRVLTARGAGRAQGSGIVLPGWGSRAFMEHGPRLLTWCRSALCKWKGHPRLPQAGKHNIHWTLFTSKCEGLISGNKWQREDGFLVNRAGRTHFN